jgi:hypothetical protein
MRSLEHVYSAFASWSDFVLSHTLFFSSHFCPSLFLLLSSLPVAMSRFFFLSSSLMAVLVAMVMTTNAKSVLPCGVGDLDFSPLAAATEISTTDWAALNFYWQPCGVLQKSHTPCSGRSFRHSGLCQVNSATNVSTSMGDWSSHGNVSWTIVDQRQSRNQSPDMLTGATLSFQSAHPSCTLNSNDTDVLTYTFSRVTIQLVCDLSGAFDLHGPLHFTYNGDACNLQMSMRTKFAC